MSIETIHSITGLSLIVLGFASIIYYIRLKHIERLELIKKGDIDFSASYLENARYSVLSKAILMIALAFGLGIGYGINRHIPDGNSQIPIYLICLLGSGGLGLLIFYFIIQTKDK